MCFVCNSADSEAVGTERATAPFLTQDRYDAFDQTYTGPMDNSTVAFMDYYAKQHGAEYVVMHTVYQTVRAWTRDEAESIARHALLDNPGLLYPVLAGDGYAVLEGS